jgi:hypothetical protein
MSTAVAGNYHSGDSYSYVTSSQLPNVTIDENIVRKQKEKALRELESRVKLAIYQHEKMYELQKAHIIAEHDRQLLLAKSAIDDEKCSALSALTQAYDQNNRGIDHAAQTQKISIEQQANLLELHAMQQDMAMKHADKERQWTSNYASPGAGSMVQGAQFTAPSQYVTSSAYMPSQVTTGRRETS